jgi:hypothetical protein
MLSRSSTLTRLSELMAERETVLLMTRRLNFMRQATALDGMAFHAPAAITPQIACSQVNVVLGRHTTVNFITTVSKARGT